MTAEEKLPSIVAQGIIQARPQEVYAALTNSQLLPRWWSAWTQCEITHAAIDLKRGGLYRIESRTKDGTVHFFRGEFLHVSPEFLAITWITDYSEGFASAVYLRLEPKGPEATKLAVEHRGLEAPEEHKRMSGGWRHILAVMQRGIPWTAESRTPAEVEEVLHARGIKPSGRPGLRKRGLHE
jgi:uncharacterized protein YndB with AHSA1/START domain